MDQLSRFNLVAVLNNINFFNGDGQVKPLKKCGE